jgi:hypothetical protein
MSDRANAGAPALLEGTGYPFGALASPRPAGGHLDAVIARFRAPCSERAAVGRGAAEFANWPADIQALATAPLYARGLPVHCLPIYGTWLFARLDAGSDLSEAVPYNQFMRMSSAALSNTGLSVARHRSHSLGRSRAGEMLHGGASELAVAEMLRHRSVAERLPLART